jgi:hypothetical protein
MKKCLICKKRLENEEEVCNTCRDFFEWKKEKSLIEHLERLKDYFSNKFNSIKFRRTK